MGLILFFVMCFFVGWGLHSLVDILFRYPVWNVALSVPLAMALNILTLELLVL